jgi:uncharacterized protein YydD (DUF2326 family)
VIFEVSSDFASFKTVNFRRGLNVLLADLSPETTERHTRNSAASRVWSRSFIFFSGSDVDKGSLFKVEEIATHSFSGVFGIGKRVVRVLRSCAKPKRIVLSAKHARRLKLHLTRDAETGECYLAVDQWREFLGAVWFGLPQERHGTDFDVKRAPTFRMLFGYFARRSRDHGYSHVDRYAERQQPGDAQVALSYLLGLDWRVPRDIRDLKERAGALRKLKSAIKAGELGAMFGTSAALRPEITRAEERVNRLRRQIESFEVLESYRDLAREASELQAIMSDLALELSSVREALGYLEKVVEDEKPPAYVEVKTLYEAAGIELPQVALRSFEDVERFQASVIENRRTYLREQIEEARADVKKLEGELASAGARRSDLLKSLSGKGAFEDLMRLNDRLGQESSRLERLRENLKNAHILENKTTENKRESAELEMRLQQDYASHEDRIKEATALVDHAISELYDDRDGYLFIEPHEDGPRFLLSISGGGNQGGIDQMKVFCFDMMLFQRVAARLGGPGFLMHDSHLFDGVDVRQARAAQLFGRKVALECRSQYIVMMNSDKFQKVNIPEDNLLTISVLKTRLTDDEEGGLFGFRFDLPDGR